jgi:hypothetical protein
MSAIRNVLKAWNDPGVNPSFHRRKQSQLHQEWPMLARALEQLTRDMPSTDDKHEDLMRRLREDINREAREDKS